MARPSQYSGICGCGCHETYEPGASLWKPPGAKHWMLEGHKAAPVKSSTLDSETLRAILSKLTTIEGLLAKLVEPDEDVPF
jgi:hypothetical protein